MLALSGAVGSFAFEDTQAVVVKLPQGDITIRVELADTPLKRSRGLMFRRHLDPNAGMLFLYDHDQEIRMWMKNTFLPLDMIFIRADGVVHRIQSHTEPFSLEAISSQGLVRAVLELNAGSAERLGIRPGDRLIHPFFRLSGP